MDEIHRYSSSDPGSLGPRYSLLETLGRGGMGVVYKALDRVEGHLVALKTLHGEPDPSLRGRSSLAPDATDHRRFDREIRVLSLLRHEGIVRLFDVGQWQGRAYFTMEYLSGLPLQALLREALPEEEEIRWIIRVALRVLEALDHLHASGFVHRDLKPSNVMVLSVRKGEGTSGGPPPTREEIVLESDPRIKLLDFGLVKAQEVTLASGRPPPGTPLYMAPEQMDPGASPDPRSDLYSLGVVLYQLITRRLPHATVASALSGKSPPPPAALNQACPEELSSAILRLLEPQPYRRFASAQEISACLFPLVADRPRPPQAPPPRLLEPAFVGRRELLEKLMDELACPAGGKGRLVAISGVRGGGKTWLLDQSGLKTRAVLEHGLSYFQGRHAPGGPLHQGLREVALEMVLELAHELPLPELPDRLGTWGGLLLDALGIDSLPSLRALFPPPEASAPVELQTERIVQAGAALFQAAARRPRLVLLDDLHLADDLDLEILARVARGIRRLPLCIAFTYRPEALELNPALRRWLSEAAAEGEERRALELHLPPMSDGEAAQMLRSMLSPQGEIDPGLVGSLLDRTGGVPRSIEATLAESWRRGLVVLSGGAWRLLPTPSGADAAEDGEGPDPLPGLDPLDRQIVSASAVLGENFEPEPLILLLAPAGGARPEGNGPGRGEEILARLFALTARGLLARTVLGFGFARTGLRERVESVLEPEERRRIHARAAEVLLALKGEASADQWDAVAGHFAAGGMPEKALEFHLKAARRAAGSYANRRGISSFRAALSLAGAGERGAVAAELGRLYARIGDYAPALECMRVADEAEGGRSPAILDDVGRIHQRRGELKPARECFERSLSLAGEKPELLARARYRLGGVRFEEGDLQSAVEHFQESLKLSRERDDLDGMAAAHSGLGLVEKRREALDSAAAHFREAIHCAERGSSPAQAATALNNLGNIQRALGNDQEAIGCFRRSLEIRERIGDRPGLAICLNNLSRVLGRRGQLSAAADAATRALRIFEEVGDRKGVLIASGNLGGFRLFAGDFAAAGEAFLRARGLAERLGDRRALADAGLCLGKLENSRGEPARAEAHLREGLRALPDEADQDLRAGLLAELAAARLAQADLEGASDAVREGLDSSPPAGGQSRGVLLFASAEIELARGETEAALERAEEALSVFEPGGPRFESALAHRLVGRAYRDLGPDWVDRAEKHLGTALERFEEMGAEVEAAVTLRDIGVMWAALGEEGEAARFFRRADGVFALRPSAFPPRPPRGGDGATVRP
jgi:serine/threonine protein kinase/tetratricopeptide (TPR) repeat protein